MTDACRACPARLMDEASKLVGASFSDIVPPQAQVHLLNAQRELLLAVAVTIEHNTARRSRSSRAQGGRSGKRAARAPSRVELD